MSSDNANDWHIDIPSLQTVEAVRQRTIRDLEPWLRHKESCVSMRNEFSSAMKGEPRPSCDCGLAKAKGKP